MSLRAAKRRLVSPPLFQTGRLVAATAMGAACLAGAAPAWAAATLVVQRGEEPPATLYADGDRMRMDMPAHDHASIGDAAFRPSAVIIDATAKKILMLHESDKTYTEITEEDMKAIQARLAATRAQFADRLKNMPPERRKQIEALNQLGDRKAQPKFTFEKKGEKKTINGIRCETYKVMLDGVPHEDDCISPWSDGVVKQSDFAGLSKFGRDMVSNMGAKNTNIPLFDQYPGLPISRVPLDEKGAPGIESQVKSVKKGPVPATLFSVPTGFTKKALPFGPGAAGANVTAPAGLPPAAPKP